jgi:hypothetical protein
MRRRAGEPLQIQPVCLRNRQGFALTGAVCEDVPVVVA